MSHDRGGESERERWITSFPSISLLRSLSLSPPLSWLIHMLHDSFLCDMTPSISLLRSLSLSPPLSWLIHMFHDSFLCDMTPVWQPHINERLGKYDFICYIRMKSHYIWHVSFICDMTHSYVTWLIPIPHDAFICDTSHSDVTYEWAAHSCVARLIHMNVTSKTHSYEFMCGKGYVTRLIWK